MPLKSKLVSSSHLISSQIGHLKNLLPNYPLLSQFSPHKVSICRHSNVHSRSQLCADCNCLVNWVSSKALKDILVDGYSSIHCSICLNFLSQEVCQHFQQSLFHKNCNTRLSCIFNLEELYNPTDIKPP